jgi:hypothetical protein
LQIVLAEAEQMVEPVKHLMLEFLNWVSSRRRTYGDVMEAWQSTCPRHTIWEDAIIDGLVEIGSSQITLTERGRAILAESAKSMQSHPPTGV